MLRFIAWMENHRMGTFEAHMIFSTFLSVDRSCDQTLKWSKEQLMHVGLRAVQTFDLHTARIGLHECPCPNHGTDECDCQMVILMVYGDVDKPETLILHGNGETTWLSITSNITSSAIGSVTDSIMNTLIGQQKIDSGNSK